MSNLGKGTVYFKDGTEEEILAFSKRGDGVIYFTAKSACYMYKSNEPKGERFYELVDAVNDEYIPAGIERIDLWEEDKDEEVLDLSNVIDSNALLTIDLGVSGEEINNFRVAEAVFKLCEGLKQLDATTVSRMINQQAIWIDHCNMLRDTLGEPCHEN